jgi:hypothetical protein
LAYQVVEGHAAGSLHVGRAGFEADHVWVGRAEFGGVLDQDQAFSRIGQR